MVRPALLAAFFAGALVLSPVRPLIADDAPPKEPTKETTKDTPKDDKAVAADLAKMEGSWTATSAIKGGDPVPDEEVKKLTVTITGNKLSISMGGHSDDATFTIDPSKSPGFFDLSPDKDVVIPGIYKVDGDTLEICFAARPGATRPTAFAAGETHNSVLKLARKK